ncbi:MAG: hypothetical protein JWQ43_2684 [Glaciihabitans sp.]|nr:hypothetical protein [Glaciihabitans sp.]
MRAKELARAKRRRWVTQGSVTLGILAVAAVIVLVVTAGGKTSAGPLNMLSDGIVVTGNGTTTSAVTTAALAADAEPVATAQDTAAGVANIVTYIDYLCPYCGQFEATNAAQIEAMVTAGTATLEIHPIAILDNSSLGSKYSTRSANAAACVANFDPDKYLAVNDALFANQPKENTTGLTDDELVSLVASAGATGDDVAECITGGEFTDWVGESTQRALDGPLPNANIDAVTGTPTVIVNGTAYTGSLTDATEFAAFVTAQSS